MSAALNKIMNLQPTFGRVIIKPDAEHNTNKLIIPEAFKKMANRGEIIAVGPGRRHIDGKRYEPPFTVGQRVMFSQLRAFKFDFEGQPLVMCEDEDVMMVIGGSVQEN